MGTLNTDQNLFGLLRRSESRELNRELNSFGLLLLISNSKKRELL